jgi:hypothetical protein
VLSGFILRREPSPQGGSPAGRSNVQKIEAQHRMLVDLCAVYPDLSGFREAFFGRISGIHHLPGIVDR